MPLEEVRETDPDGRIVVHHREIDTLGRMLKAGTVSEAMAEAGWRFQRQFGLAQLDPLRAPDLCRIPGNGREADPDDIGITAREQAHNALRALGGYDAALGSVPWHVLGCGCSLPEWTLRRAWGGRQVRQEEARGILIAALDLLALHYGTWARPAA